MPTFASKSEFHAVMNLEKDGIYIAPGGSLTIYMVGQQFKIAGRGVVNHSGNAAAFNLFGLPTCTDIQFNGNGCLHRHHLCAASHVLTWWRRQGCHRFHRRQRHQDGRDEWSLQFSLRRKSPSRWRRSRLRRHQLEGKITCAGWHTDHPVPRRPLPYSNRSRHGLFRPPKHTLRLPEFSGTPCATEGARVRRCSVFKTASGPAEAHNLAPRLGRNPDTVYRV